MAGQKRRKRFSLMSAILLARMQQCEAKFASRAEFVKKIGVSEGTYWLLLQRASNPTIDTMEKIAEGLGMTVFELIGNIDHKTLRARVAMVGLDLDAIKANVDKGEQLTAEFESIVGRVGSVSRSVARKLVRLSGAARKRAAAS